MEYEVLSFNITRFGFNSAIIGAMRDYKLREKPSADIRAALSMHPELVQDLLFFRGITSAEAAAAFLEPSYDAHSHDPFLMPDMGKAVERILRAAAAGEKIAVWSDYDCDGIPGGVMLAEFLRALGIETTHYIPHRHGEGYGLNQGGIDILAADGVSLIITVDLGTSDREPIAHANAKGVNVIVTDHHLVSGELPPAFAVLNPKRADSRYPFPYLCGAGVAWKLVQAILSKNRPEGFAMGHEKWLLDLVGLATLSDMVPLTGENRMLAYYGLKVMQKTRRPGLSALLRMLRIEKRFLSEDDVGFMVAPRLNAASRMDSPELAARLLATQDETEGMTIARQLNHINDERKGVVAATVKEVRKRLRDVPQTGMIVMGNPNWRPGILGLVANSLAESEKRAVCLWGREGGALLRGSCRSDGSLNVVSLMSHAKDMFDDFGGHAFSGGFALREERVHEFPQRMQEAYAAALKEGVSEPERTIDRELDLEEATAATLRQVRRLAPFGEGNRKPLFAFPNAQMRTVRMFGKVKDHLDVSLARGSTTLSAIAFFSNPESFTKRAAAGERGDIIGHLETDWGGRPRIRIVDIL